MRDASLMTSSNRNAAVLTAASFSRGMALHPWSAICRQLSVLTCNISASSIAAKTSLMSYWSATSAICSASCRFTFNCFPQNRSMTRLKSWASSRTSSVFFSSCAAASLNSPQNILRNTGLAMDRRKLLVANTTSDDSNRLHHGCVIMMVISEQKVGSIGPDRNVLVPALFSYFAYLMETKQKREQTCH